MHLVKDLNQWQEQPNQDPPPCPATKLTDPSSQTKGPKAVAPQPNRPILLLQNLYVLPNT
jgi:hypothetical protein